MLDVPNREDLLTFLDPHQGATSLETVLLSLSACLLTLLPYDNPHRNSLPFLLLPLLAFLLRDNQPEDL